MMRMVLFLATNVAVMVVITIVSSLFGINPRGLVGVMIMSLIVGFAGSIISLFMSKSMAKRSMGVHIIDKPSNSNEQWLVDVVRKQAEQADIGMPEVGVFDSSAPNAFATGANKNNALVAVSTGLLQSMKQHEVEAVLAHEISHVANGDMITMTLIQGVINTFVYFAATLVSRAVASSMKNRALGSMLYYPVMIGSQMVFGFLGSIIAMWFSRWREFRADAGAAKLSSAQDMIAALQALQRSSGTPAEMPTEMAALGIRPAGIKSTMQSLLMTHPPLEKRIEALQNSTNT